MIEVRVVELIADHLAASRARVLAACRDHRDIASLTHWTAREAADALWEARHELCTIPPTAIWRPAAPIFLLGSEAGAPSKPPPPSDGDLWVDIVAVPSASSVELAGKALAAGRERFTRLRESRGVGEFTTVAIAMIRAEDDLQIIDRLIGDLGDPTARERFGSMAGPWGMVGDVLAWHV